MNNSPEPQPDYLAQIAEAKEVFEKFSGKQLDLPNDDELTNINKAAAGAVKSCLYYADKLEKLVSSLEKGDLEVVIESFLGDEVISHMFNSNTSSEHQMSLSDLISQPSLAYTPELKEAFIKMFNTLKHVSDLMVEKEKEINEKLESKKPLKETEANDDESDDFDNEYIARLDELNLLPDIDSIVDVHKRDISDLDDESLVRWEEWGFLETNISSFFEKNKKNIDNLYAMLCNSEWIDQNSRDEMKKVI